MSAKHDESSELIRLEDFIALASKGEKVTVEVDLKKQFVSQKVHPDETDDMKNEIGMYLLMANYLMSGRSEIKTISKVYVTGSDEESSKESKVNAHIANERLKMDYQRLKDANIKFEEKFF